MKLSDLSQIEIDLKSLITVIVITAAVVGGYYDLKKEIREAANSPVSRGEYEMKFLYQGDKIIELQKQVEELKERISQ